MLKVQSVLVWLISEQTKVSPGVSAVRVGVAFPPVVTVLVTVRPQGPIDAPLPAVRPSRRTAAPVWEVEHGTEM